MACEAMISQGIWGDGEITMTGEIIMTSDLPVDIYIYTHIYLDDLLMRQGSLRMDQTARDLSKSGQTICYTRHSIA